MLPAAPLGKTLHARALCALYALLATLLISAAPARVQASITLRVSEINVQLPDGIQFHVQASSDAKIERVTLLYGANGKSCLSSTVRHEMDIAEGRVVDARWSWNFYQSGSVPPGVEVWWQWEIRDESGATLLTPKKTQRISDARYTWNELRQGNITLQWSEGSYDFAQSMLSLAAASLRRLEREVGIPALQSVRMVFYPSAEELKGAILDVPGWTGGLAFSDYSLVVIAIAPGQDEWARSVVPHELAHLVTGELTYNCVGGRVPTWLTEGISVYTEGEADEASRTALERALRNGKLTPLDQLTQGFAADSQRADLAYAQSGEIVRYLAQEFGPQQINALLAEIKAGSSADEALQAVYGFDTTGLDNAWRASLGAAPVPTRPPTQPPAQRTTIPTIALWSAASATPAVTHTLPPIPSQTPRPTATAAPTASPSPQPTPTATPAPAARGAPVTALAAAVLAGLLLAGWLAYQRFRR